MNLDLIIGFYMFICASLLVFNIAYILRAKGKSRKRLRRERWWLKEIQAECRRLEGGAGVSDRHLQLMERRLRRVEWLMAYHEAVLKMLESAAPYIQQYLDAGLTIFQALALEYGKAPAMERAFFAHVISVYHPARDRGCGQLPQLLMDYFDGSTVFCRENLLRAFYAMGQPVPIEQAFARISDQGWYHHPRLLSDGLASFPGDKEALAWRLWRRCGGWSEPFQVAVVQFATGVSDAFSGEFLAALRNTSLLETRFALVRYFQRRRYPAALPALLELLEQDDGSGLAIAAASALVNYPGWETRRGLLAAMHSCNWYVRRNAALSLVKLGITTLEIERLEASGDRYAIEMLQYALGENAAVSAPAPMVDRPAPVRREAARRQETAV